MWILTDARWIQWISMVDLKANPYYLSEGDCKWVEETIAGMSVVSAGCLMRGCSYNNVTIQGLTLYKIVV